LKKEGAQGWNHRSENMVADVVQGHSDFPNLSWRSLAEAYPKNVCEIHLHCRDWVAGGGLVPCNYCVVFDRSQISLDVRDADRGSAGRTGEEGDGSGYHKNHVGQAVLVDARKLMEYPQRMGGEVLSSTVRLQSLDDCPRDWRDAPDFAALLVGPHGTVAKNGELRSLSDLRRQRGTGVGFREGVGEVVKGGTEIVNAVPDDKPDTGGRLFEYFDPDEFLACLRIRLVGNVIRVSLAPPSVFRFQVLQVMQRPL
jgi:hypothetical protein